MNPADRLAAVITAYSRPVIAVMLLVTVVAGAGAGLVEQSSSLNQFQSDTPEAEALETIEETYETGQDNTTTAQVIFRGEDVLSRDSLRSMLDIQQTLRANQTVNQTLVADRPISGVANLVAIAGILEDRQQELRQTNAAYEDLNETVRTEAAALARRASEVNETRRALVDALETLGTNESATPRGQFESVNASSALALDERQSEMFTEAARLYRSAEAESERQTALHYGSRDLLGAEYGDLAQRREDLEAQQTELGDLGSRLETLKAALATPAPSLAEQRATMAELNATEFDRARTRVVGENASGELSGLGLMSTDYRPGSGSANATMMLVTHQTGGTGGQGTVSAAIVDAQLALQAIADEQAPSDSQVIVFGGGIMTEEINNSMADSLAIVGPLALLFVVVTLALAYRDVLDILLGLFGIIAVLVWTFGFMGWAGIAFNQMFIAVPVLLIGLSIDYAIHIFMRNREQRQERGTYGDDDVRGSMRVALAGVGVALVWVTATTAIGFLSNLTSPVPPIQDFGIVSAVGITAALLVFGVLIPALKVEMDGFLEARGIDRRKRAFGTGGGLFSRVLSAGSTAARRGPALVIVCALLLSLGGAYGATQVDTTFDQEDFIAEDPPAWADSLPEPFRPGEYTMKENLQYVNENFVREDSQAQILVRGNVTDDDTLERLAAAQRRAAESDVVVTLSSGEGDIQSPLDTMERVAAENETFNATFLAADTDGNGVPDQNVAEVYDALFATAPAEASRVIHRTEAGDRSGDQPGGEYRSLRMVVSTSGDAAMGDVTDEMRSVASGLSGAGLTATATGQTILFDIVSDQLMDTVIQSLLITLVAVFAFLMVTYRVTDGSATLGAVTLLPVVFSVAWILGTMYLLGIPFNVMTGMITSLTVGLGVAYSIHMSERYKLELDRTGSVWEAMSRAVTGTGGALLGSAATTVGGFGVLAFAILPPLQQFGIITGMTIIYAFLASVLVLPSLLVLWTKYLGPAGAFEPTDESSRPQTGEDGGLRAPGGDE